MVSFSQWKLHTRLLVSLLLVGMLIIVAISVTGYLTTRAALLSQARLTATSLVERSAFELDGLLRLHSVVAEVIAAHEARTVNGPARIAALEETLPVVLGQYPRLKNAYVYFDKQAIPGRDYADAWATRENNHINLVRTNMPGNVGFDPAKPIFEYHGLAWFTQSITATGTTWSDPYIDEVSQVALVSGTAPIRQQGKFLGVAGVDFSLAQMPALLGAIKPTVNSYTFLVSTNGTMIANPLWPDQVIQPTLGTWVESITSPTLTTLYTNITQQQSGMIEMIDPRSTQIAWAAYKVLPSTRWTAVMIMPQQDLLGGVTVLRQRFLSLGVGSLLLLALLAWLIARSIARPVRTLAQATERMAAGDLTTRVIFPARDELGALASSFNTMAATLEERMAAEQAAQAQAQQLQGAERDSRQQLEQTVGAYLAFVQQVAQGDLTQRLAVEQHDVLGQLAHGLNGMVERLHAITHQVQQATTNMTAAATEILATTTQQAASAAEQSAAITQTSTTIEEVKAIAVQTARQAGQVAEDSQGMLHAAQGGSRAVQATVAGMGEIQQRVESIAQTILALAEQTQAISAIITTVGEIADHSNLLALNAAIEAARAGEQGKSFAVVAQHVRELAERSKGATAQVRDILGEIQRATNHAVLVTEEGTKGVEQGARLSQEAGEVIQRIAGEVESGAQANIQMAAAAQQQTAGMDQISLAISSIQQATAQGLASTRQAERAAQDLHELAQSLQQAIAAYRL